MYFSADNVIVRSHPGEGTGDTVFVTERGRELHVTASAGIPHGYRWRDRPDFSHIRLSVEEPPKRPKRNVCLEGLRPLYVPRCRESMRIALRPESHARSNPRGR